MVLNILSSLLRQICLIGLGQNTIRRFFARLSSIKNRALESLSTERIERLLDSKWRNFDVSLLLILGMIAFYTIVFSYFTIIKYNAFRAYAWDLGIFNQIFWNTLHGKPLYSTAELFIIPSGISFGTHLSPILFLILPIYAIYPAPETLLALQSFILALSALPVYMLARDSFNRKLAGVVFAMAYLLYSPLHGINWFDFHPQAFLPVLFLFAIYYLTKGKWLRYFFFTVLALTVAENVSIMVMFVGLYCLWLFRQPIYTAIFQKKFHDRKIFIPIITIGLGISWFFLARWIQGTFFPINPQFYQTYKALSNWSVLGVANDPIEMPIYIILHPWKAFEALSYDAYLKLLYIILIFGPLQFQSVRSSLSFVTLAWLGPALLSNYSPYYLLGGHFPAYVIPFVFAAAVKALEKDFRRVHIPYNKGYLKNILVLGFLSSLFISPLSPLILTAKIYLPYFSDYYIPNVGEHEVLLQRIVNLVPPDASVLTHNNIFPHFSGRLDAYVYPLSSMVSSLSEVEMQNYIEELFRKSEYVMTDNVFDPDTTNQILSRIQNGTDYGLYAYGDEIYLFKRGYSDSPTLFES